MRLPLQLLRSNLYLCCAFVAVETRQNPLHVLGSEGAGLPHVANEIVVVTLFMVPRWRLYQYACGGCL